jgi:prepilin-type N-terminal cleavage/methylation domain-containing protein
MRLMSRSFRSSVIRCIARRRGFTLIELLIAMVLVAVGFVAITASGGLVARELRAASARSAAALAALNRVERFLAGVCPTGASSGQTNPALPVREYWRIERDGLLSTMHDSITYLEYASARALVVSTSRAC